MWLFNLFVNMYRSKIKNNNNNNNNTDHRGLISTISEITALPGSFEHNTHHHCKEDIEDLSQISREKILGMVKQEIGAMAHSHWKNRNKGVTKFM